MRTNRESKAKSRVLCARRGAAARFWGGLEAGVIRRISLPRTDLTVSAE